MLAADTVALSIIAVGSLVQVLTPQARLAKVNIFEVNE
jgi:hypothetical protein